MLELLFIVYLNKCIFMLPHQLFCLYSRQCSLRLFHSCSSKISLAILLFVCDSEWLSALREMNLWIKEKYSLNMNQRKMFFKSKNCFLISKNCLFAAKKQFFGINMQFFDLENIFLRFIFREHFSLIPKFISLSE